MRWTRLAALLVACCSEACLAETPDFSGNRPQAMQLFQGRLFSGQGWWSRYGEPVNSTALSAASTQPGDKTMAAPMSDYGDGYIFGPGACDCPPPCIWHLWAGYFQNPKRCHPHVMKHVGCANCNGDPVACGCAPVRGTLAKIFNHGCCNACGYNDSCSCTAPTCSAPTCTTAATDCVCKPVCGKCRPCHVANKWRCFTAHWNCGCDCSCSAPSCSCGAPSCGCATPASTPAPSEKQVRSRVPTPLPEEALLHPLPRLN